MNEAVLVCLNGPQDYVISLDGAEICKTSLKQRYHSRKRENIIHWKTAMKSKSDLKHWIRVERKQLLRLFTAPYFSVSLALSSAGCHFGLSMRANTLGWWGCEDGEKIRETVTASLRLVLTALVAPATATPDWSKGQLSSSEHSRERLQLEWQKVMMNDETFLKVS